MAPPLILVDADACPVKEEIYKVAFRHEVAVKIVSNAPLRVPAHPLIERIVVGAGFDAADDWIAERAGSHSVVVTGDILLADRCLKAGASVIGTTASRLRPPRSARRWRPGRSWPIFAPVWTAPAAARRLSPRRTDRASSRRWTRPWSGSSGHRLEAR